LDERRERYERNKGMEAMGRVIVMERRIKIMEK
jgi:hypothetical protein